MSEEQFVNQQPQEGGGTSNNKGGGTDVTKIVLIVILCILLFPLICAVGGVAIGLVCAAFGILIAFAAVAFAGWAAGFALMVTAWFMLPSIGDMLLTEGIGLVAIAVAAALTVAFAWLLLKALPAAVRGVVRLVKKLFHKGGEQA